MGIYESDHDYDLLVVVYDGKDTADRAFDATKELEEQGMLKVREAAVFTRNDQGKIKLKNKGYVAGWKGGAIGLGIGLLLGGPIAGAAIGGLIGFARGNDRRNVRGMVNEKLGTNNSALAVIAEDINWEAIDKSATDMGGELMHAELQGSSMTKLEELAADDDVQEATEEEIEVAAG